MVKPGRPRKGSIIQAEKGVDYTGGHPNVKVFHVAYRGDGIAVSFRFHFFDHTYSGIVIRTHPTPSSGGKLVCTSPSTSTRLRHCRQEKTVDFATHAKHWTSWALSLASALQMQLSASCVCKILFVCGRRAGRHTHPLCVHTPPSIR